MTADASPYPGSIPHLGMAEDESVRAGEQKGNPPEDARRRGGVKGNPTPGAVAGLTDRNESVQPNREGVRRVSKKDGTEEKGWPQGVKIALEPVWFPRRASS